MRVSLSLTLIVSSVLHAGVAGGIALGYFLHRSTSEKPSIPPPQPTIVLLRSEETPGNPQVPHTAPARHTVAETVPAPLPSPARTITAKMTSAHTIPQKMVVEANPNAHVPALPPEAVLSPTPAPVLNGHDGTVFILDVSGSMYEPYAGSTRLAFAREALSSQIHALKDGTPFAITLYAMNACTSGPLVAANDATREAAVRYIMRDVDCGGGTNLPAGLAAAENLHAGNLVLASDGDLNISTYDLMTQARGILGEAGHCPGLTVIGIGPRANTSADHLLQSLADQQEGIYRPEQFDGETPLLTSASSADKPQATP